MSRTWNKERRVIDMPDGKEAILWSSTDEDGRTTDVIIEQGYPDESCTRSLLAVATSLLFHRWLIYLDERFAFRQHEVMTGDGKKTFMQIHAGRIVIQSVDMFGGRIGFIKLKADLVDEKGNFIPGIVFLRGDSAAVLVVLTCNGKEYAVLLRQPRAATGTFGFCEIPAGMLDGSGDFIGTAAKELKEETSITIHRDELVELGNCYPSPGACDEQIGLSYVEREVDEQFLADLQGKCTGMTEEGELITLRVVPLDDLPKYAGADMKSMLAYYMYQMRQVEKAFELLGEALKAMPSMGE